MNTQTNDTAVSTLEETIDRVFESLETYEPATDEYATVVDQLAKLYQMKKIDNDFKLKDKELTNQCNKFVEDVVNDANANALKSRELDNFDRLSKAQLATILANLAGIAVIMSHERTHIIVTKAFGLLSKLK